MILAHLGRRLGAHPLGEIRPRQIVRQQPLPPRPALRPPLLQHGRAGGPAQFVVRGDELIDDAHAPRGGAAQQASGEHGLHGGHRTGQPQHAHRAVQAGDDAELHLGQAEPRALLAVGDAIMAGHGELQSAAEAIAVDGRDRRYGQALDAVEHLRHLPANRLDIGLARELIEFADVGAGDKARLLCPT